MAIRKVRRPGILIVGTLEPHGEYMLVSGWTVGLCQARCGCHRAPDTHELVVQQDDKHGTLGLVKHRPCWCCEPWTVTELAGMLDDLAAIEALETVPESEPS